MAGASSSAPSGAAMTFDDEFNSLSLWNGASGTWATDFWYADQAGNGSSLPSTGEQEWYINAAYAGTSSVKPWSVSNGVLSLTAQTATAAISSLINGYQITSGELNTYHSFSQTYGYFEMRAQLPAVQGMWPAFWLLPESGAWPPELDVMEVLGKASSTLYTTVHSAASGTHVATGVGTTVANTAVGYHTYGVDWEASAITWYYDGQPIYQVATPADMHQAMYMIVNLAVGGAWAGMVNTSQPIHAQMQVDYIRAYSSLPAYLSPTANPNVITVGAAATAGQLTASVAQTLIGNGLGDTLTSNDAGSTLIGGAGADTLIAGHGADTLTGGGGVDTFVFKYLPWSAGHITDFIASADKIDLSALFATTAYHGANPIKDGYISLVSDGAGGSKVYFDPSPGASGVWPTLITTLDHVAPAALTNASFITGVSVDPNTITLGASVTAGQLTASVAQTLVGNNLGDTLTSNDAGSTLIGGAGIDTLIAGHGADTLTGGGGADSFVFKYLPWNAGHITDFNPGADVIDLSALFAATAYHGANPIKDGYISLASDGAGGAKVYFDPSPGVSGVWPTLITTLDHVAPTAVTNAWFITGAAAPATAAAASVPANPNLITLGAAVTTGHLTASVAQTLVGNNLGDTLTSNDAGSTLIGGLGADTLIAGHGADSLTGGGGHDAFVFKVLPWNAGHVTDFAPSNDVLDLSALFASIGYHGTDPVADGHLNLVANSAGGTAVYFDPSPGASGIWPTLITTLDHVAPTSLHAGDWII